MDNPESSENIDQMIEVPSDSEQCDSDAVSTQETQSSRLSHMTTLESLMTDEQSCRLGLKQFNSK